MKEFHKESQSPHVIWVSTVTPSTTLDSATWLDTTRELRRLGWLVTLIGMGSAGRQNVRGVEILCLPRPQVYFLGILIFHLNVLRIIRREWVNTEVILFHQFSAFWLLPLRFVRLVLKQQRPLLIMDTRDFADFYPRNIKPWIRSFYNKLAFWLAVKLVDGQTTITNRMAKFAKVPSRQLLGVWPSGVNLESFSLARISRHWPSADEPIQLIYIGIFAKKRNLSLLCQTVEQVNASGMLFVLTLVGAGKEHANLEVIAQKSPSQIRVLAPIPHDKIPDLLAQAHVGVTSLPSPNETKYQASSPIKLFEYMAAGLPILSTSNACHTEVVGNGSYAFWVDSIDEAGILAALRQIWLCRANLAQMGAEAATAANSWTWAASARKLSDALQQGLAK